MNLTDGLTEHLQDVTPPPPDLDRVVDRGRRRRRARMTAQAAAMVLVAGAIGGTAMLLRAGAGGVVNEPPPLSTGPMDLSQGLRAYGDPGRVVVLGGRTVSAKDLSEDGWLYLDTDAAATPKGIVYFRSGAPWLLTAAGTSRPLWTADAEDPKGWHPTAKADAREPVVAFAVIKDGKVTLVVRGLDSDVRTTIPVDCDGPSGCDKLVVDGIDSGVVFVRTSTGTYTWRYTDDRTTGLEPFAGAKTRVADVRNRTVLYDGPRPTVTLEGWRYVAGAIDAQLTFDGAHVLYWSPDLKPVEPGDATIHLDLPKSAQFFTVDTDGSILAATVEDPTRFFDCELPSGACEQIGELQVTGGDPQFIGNDM